MRFGASQLRGRSGAGNDFSFLPQDQTEQVEKFRLRNEIRSVGAFWCKSVEGQIESRKGLFHSAARLDRASRKVPIAKRNQIRRCVLVQVS